MYCTLDCYDGAHLEGVSDHLADRQPTKCAISSTVPDCDAQDYQELPSIHLRSRTCGWRTIRFS